jgi:hypothetical protein
VKPDPCPHCGEELRPHYDHQKTKIIAWVHPSLKEMREEYGPDWWCFHQGSSIGAELIKYWAKSASASPPPAPPPPPVEVKLTGKKWVTLRFTINGGDQVFNLCGMADITDTKDIYNGD